jgi:hypothetical protein
MMDRQYETRRNMYRPRCQCTCVAKVAHRTVEKSRKEDDPSSAAAVLRGTLEPARAEGVFAAVRVCLAPCQRDSVWSRVLVPIPPPL